MRIAALGHAANRQALDLNPLGMIAEFLDCGNEPDWVSDYHAANAECFPSALALPGWVLADLFLLPSAICLLTAPGEWLGSDRKRAIWAAYCCVPTVVPGTVMGVSLLSRRHGHGAGFVAKALGLAMHRAQRQRGLTQWENPALRVHTQFGPLKVLGPAPAQHALSGRSFAYEVALGETSEPLGIPQWIPSSEGPNLAARAAAGASIHVVTPGLAGEQLCVVIDG